MRIVSLLVKGNKLHEMLSPLEKNKTKKKKKKKTTKKKKKKKKKNKKYINLSN